MASILKLPSWRGLRCTHAMDGASACIGSAFDPAIDPAVKGKEHEQVARGAPEDLPCHRDHVLLECAPWFHDNPEDAKREQGAECAASAQCQ